MTDRQPACMGAGQTVGVALGFGGMISACSWCGRDGLSVNKDGTLRYHVAVLEADMRIPRGKASAQPTRAPTLTHVYFR